MNEIEELLCVITKCPNVEKGRNSEFHPCRQIVAWQNWDDFRVPEPWSGDLDKSKILYIALNPSKRIQRSAVPKWNESCKKTIDFFTDRIKSARGRWWSNLKNRTLELGDNYQYVVTNVVHCKSKGKSGYNDCYEVCCDLYLDKIINISKAKMIVSIGDAKEAIKRLYKFSPKEEKITYRTIGSDERLFAWLPRHIGSIGKFCNNYNLKELEILKKWLKCHC